ncbi:Phosphonoacetate hydrolase [Pseudocercospora fuligena]|uniref:Phosphonoacetate hydrolase n=1 Tax=Pseudocercospora fuligena TaxID=685502 RepID=A0A8H6RQ60_9PEZI|nr:Phosphonoacetate hydrolase [Pseudocercospora fuligena]
MAVQVLPSIEAHAQDTIRELFAFILKQGNSDYLGEAVSQLQHSLQTATLAQNAGADEETVLGALLHDVGRFIPAAEKERDMFFPDGTFAGKASHEVLGEAYLRQLGFSDKICQLVGAHVWAKRYLTAVDKGYYDGLSLSSKTTLKYQGGPFTDEQVKEAQKDPLLENKLTVRRFDDLAKDPDMRTPDLHSFETGAVKALAHSRAEPFELHGRMYQLPTRPTVVICVDGFDPEYLDRGINDGILPVLGKLKVDGFHATAKSCMPSFTNPNNVSIITGAPPAKHGISGNFFLDRKTGEEKMILDDSLLIGSTILEQMSKRGVRVAAITAKDKLRKILQHGLDNAICFSAEKAASCTLEENGIAAVESWLAQKQPSQYSGELSMFVLDAGIKLLEEDRADLFYLTLSDYIQHKYAPGSDVANAFMKSLDSKIGKLIDLGARVTVTGDHGMSDKSSANGTPNVLYLEDLLAEKWGFGRARVICPITDPFVKHHGALGSFVRVYVSQKDDTDDMLQFCKTLPNVEVAMESREAVQKFDLHPDREGDFIVIPTKHAVIGSRKDEHDLSNLGDHRLRSHGGVRSKTSHSSCRSL